MGFQEHPDFEQPANREAAIWRYLDFTKLVALLTDSSLYFSRADRLGDDFEGSYPSRNVELRPETLRAAGIPDAAIQAVINQREMFGRNLPRLVFVNCWSASEWESAALWSIYATRTQGVALRSTYRRLTDALRPYPDHPINVAAVRYLNYDERDAFSERNVLNPFIHKRRSFDFERELRAFIWDMSYARGEAWSEGEGPPGIRVPVRLTDLIERIHVAPEASPWFKELVSSTVQRYAPGLEVRQSAMTARGPVY